MAQHDYVIDNQSFPATRTDLNNVLQAIVSNNSGTSAPSTPFANQIWYDSNANILYIRNEDNDANIPLMQFDQSADVAATLATVIDILDASGTDQGGQTLTIRAGAGTGTGAGGKIKFEVADGGSSGSSVNSHATAVTITDDGKVGIGTSSPSHALTVAGVGARIELAGANEDIDMDSNANGQLKLDGNGYAGAIALNASGMRIYHNSSSLPLIFGTNETERMRIDGSTGNVGIGDTTPGSPLEVKATAADFTYAVTIFHDGNNVASRGMEIIAGTDDNSGSNPHIDFRDGDGTFVGRISSTSGTVTYGPFTAMHPCILPDADNDTGYPYGTLLETTSLSYTQKNGADTERGLIYNVRKTQSANSKAVLGAYGSSENDTGGSNENAGQEFTNRHQVLVLGDGHILCNNSGGNISIGDGICSSAAAGIGQKATANPSMIIGIAQEDVTFANDTETKLVAVQYGLQQFVPWS